MKLLTKAIEKKLEKYPLYSQYGKGMNAEVLFKVFNPCGNGTWIILEGNKQSDGDYELFGLADLGYGFEYGYMMLSELQNVRTRFGLGLERDYMYDAKGVKLGEMGIKIGCC